MSVSLKASAIQLLLCSPIAENYLINQPKQNFIVGCRLCCSRKHGNINLLQKWEQTCINVNAAKKGCYNFRFTKIPNWHFFSSQLKKCYTLTLPGVGEYYIKRCKYFAGVELVLTRPL